MYGDKESKLLYNGRRSYRPEDGVYTQNDPIGLGGGLNRRAGLDGNPLGKSDPTGLSTCRWIGPVLQCNWGPPPSLDPDNPYGRDVTPSLRPWHPQITTPGAIIGTCLALGRSLTDWMLSDSGDEALPSIEKTPTTHPDDFEPVKGAKGKRNIESGEIWEKDQLHKDHWEVYGDKRDYEKGKRDRDVWVDGRPKRKF